MDIGPKLKKMRENSNLTQQDVADLLFITRQTLSKWETGVREPSVSALIDLSKIYHTSLNNLTGTAEGRGFDEGSMHNFFKFLPHNALILTNLLIMSVLVTFVAFIYSLIFIIYPSICLYQSIIGKNDFKLFLFGKMIGGMAEFAFLILTFAVGIALLFIVYHIVMLYVKGSRRYLKYNFWSMKTLKK